MTQQDAGARLQAGAAAAKDNTPPGLAGYCLEAELPWRPALRHSYSRKSTGLTGLEFFRISKCSFGRFAEPELPAFAIS